MGGTEVLRYIEWRDFVQSSLVHHQHSKLCPVVCLCRSSGKVQYQPFPSNPPEMYHWHDTLKHASALPWERNNSPLVIHGTVLGRIWS